MMKNNKQIKKDEGIEVADHQYDPSDYESTNEVEQGLATAHEQVSDAYVEGTIDGTINNDDGKDMDLSRGSYGNSNQFKEK